MTEINSKVKNSVHTTNKLASSGNTKKPLLANITTFMKRGSDVVKDKVSKVYIKNNLIARFLNFLNFS